MSVTVADSRQFRRAQAADPAPHDPAPHADLLVARAVLATEADGIAALARTLDATFAAACDVLDAASGRVVVSGMGKSGHVARKIAATFASTGTPAFFVHPAEASHGDLGMLVAGDVVLALSNSGETAELADLVAHAGRHGLPLIAITAEPDSALARAADLVLRLPRAAEACALGVAPTTSTTMQMALGDALAVALLRRRGFTVAQFRDFHPGGKLGARLRHVSDIMHTGDAIPLGGPQTRLQAALLIMTEKRLGCIGVVGQTGQLIGIVTDGDLRRHLGPDMLDQALGAFMTENPRTIGADALAEEALRTMNEDRPVTTLFVVDALGRPIGIVHVHDLLRIGLS